MKKICCRILPLSLLVICGITQVTLAADQDISGKSDGWLASGDEVLGPFWYQKNPIKFNEIPNSLLYHFSLNYSYSGMTGNVEVEKHNVSTELALRKQLFTSITTYDAGKNDTELSLTGMSTSVESQEFKQVFKYALTDWMEAVGGLMWTINNSSKYLKNRTVYYGGPWVDIISRPGLALGMGVSYAYLDTEYMNDSITGTPLYVDFPPVDDYNSGSLFFIQMFRWDLTDTIAFTENATHLQDLENTDYYNWNINLALEFGLTKHLSVVTSYTVDYDYNSFVEAVQQYLDERRAVGKPAGNMEELDTTVAVGIKINF